MKRAAERKTDVSTLDEARAREIARRLDRALELSGQVLLDKERNLRLALSCMLASGHLLIEDLPGVGKTILAHLLAHVFSLDFRRIQFTTDLLPADVLGFSVYERETGRFRFHPGPIFSQVLLADEINRATPKAQSALLEAMEERQVTVESETRLLPRPFFVIATQNPYSQIGTYPLPESQVDRFTMRLELGYPGTIAEKELLMGVDRRRLLDGMEFDMDAARLLELQGLVEQVYASPALVDYLQEVLRFTRESPHYMVGLSPRAGLAALACARSWALIHGRTHVLPEDIQAVLPGTIGHRLYLRGERKEALPYTLEERVRELIDEVPIP